MTTQQLITTKLDNMKTKPPKIKFIGDTRSGYTLAIYNPNDDYKADLQLTREEAELVVNAILKKIQ